MPGPARDPRLLELLAVCEPVSVEDAQWAQPMRLSSYLYDHPVIDDLIVSVRCLVQVDDLLVVCTDFYGEVTALPGGGREPGETIVETACREIHEETGWALMPHSLEQVGFIHIANMGEPMPRRPYPDALHLVMSGQATECAGENWVDTEGHVVSSRLEPLDSLDVTGLGVCSAPFVEALRQRRTR